MRAAFLPQRRGDAEMSPRLCVSAVKLKQGSTIKKAPLRKGMLINAHERETFYQLLNRIPTA